MYASMNLTDLCFLFRPIRKERFCKVSSAERLKYVRLPKNENHWDFIILIVAVVITPVRTSLLNLMLLKNNPGSTNTSVIYVRASFERHIWRFNCHISL